MLNKVSLPSEPLVPKEQLVGGAVLAASQSGSGLHGLTLAKALLFPVFWGAPVVMIRKFFTGRIQIPLVLLIYFLVPPRCPLECEHGSWRTVGLHNILGNECVS